MGFSVSLGTHLYVGEVSLGRDHPALRRSSEAILPSRMRTARLLTPYDL